MQYGKSIWCNRSNRWQFVLCREFNLPKPFEMGIQGKHFEKKLTKVLLQTLVTYGLVVMDNRQHPEIFPDSKVHGANMSAPDGPHVGPMNFAILVDNRVMSRDYLFRQGIEFFKFKHVTVIMLRRTYNIIIYLIDSYINNSKITHLTFKWTNTFCGFLMS